MKINHKMIGLTQNQQGYVFYTLVDINQVDELNKLLEKDCTVEVKRKTKKRSLDANAYFWTLLSQLAKEFTIPLGDAYVKMIKRYGVFETLAVPVEAYPETERRWNIANTKVDHEESLCDIILDNGKYVKFNAFFGSSTYTSKEFSKLIEGVVVECNSVGIQTITDDELKRMMANYGG